MLPKVLLTIVVLTTPLSIHNIHAVDQDRLKKVADELIEIEKTKRLPPEAPCPLYDDKVALATEWGRLRSDLDSTGVTDSNIAEAEKFIEAHKGGWYCDDRNSHCSAESYKCECYSFRFDFRNSKYPQAKPSGTECLLQKDSPCSYNYDLKCQEAQRCVIGNDNVLCSEENNSQRDLACGLTKSPKDVDCICKDVIANVTQESYKDPEQSAPDRIPNCTGYFRSGYHPSLHQIDKFTSLAFTFGLTLIAGVVI